ncbi:MAG: metallophosphoesterase [Crocinitomicaceae bacterium]|nr:metallophosphatase [Flavobacteriales bacterium]NQZ36507.1 metallophosphoesterase [Crocinitomicaceae bacterium]
MERRKFIQNTVLVSGGLILAPSLIAQNSSEVKAKNKLTILHTNDTHSNIDPFPENHARYPGKGGVARRYEIIQKIRSEEENVLLLDAGDIFQGTPYFNKFGGILEMKLMTKLGYDVATMGNHDFDGGMDGFVKAQEFADFPFVCSNYEFGNTPIDGHTEDYKIIKKGGVKIGIFGLGVELKGLVPDDKYGETVYLDPIEVANDRAAKLKKKGCDLIICLSHLGYEYGSDKISDRVLAKKTSGIHLIIGGHTHTFLEKPTEELNTNGETVLVNQVGWAGVQLGRIDFEFDTHRFSRKDVLIVQ